MPTSALGARSGAQLLFPSGPALRLDLETRGLRILSCRPRPPALSLPLPLVSLPSTFCPDNPSFLGPELTANVPIWFLGFSSSCPKRKFLPERNRFLNHGKEQSSRGRCANVSCAAPSQNEKLSRNETQMDSDRSLRLAKALRNATQHTGPLFGNDVRTAYQLLARVLLHESGRQGFELAATRDADFHQVRACGGSSLGGPAG